MSKERPDQPQPPTLEELARIATEVTLLHGYHPPTVFIAGSRRMVTAGFEELAPTHEERVRQMFAAGYALAPEAQVGRLQQVYFISEGWLSSAEGGQALTRPPSEDPARKEVLLVSGLEIANRQSALVMHELVRDDDGTLRELREVRRSDDEGVNVESPLLLAFVAGFQARITGSHD
jgi:hypothetical protein